MCHIHPDCFGARKILALSRPKTRNLRCVKPGQANADISVVRKERNYLIREGIFVPEADGWDRVRPTAEFDQWND